MLILVTSGDYSDYHLCALLEAPADLDSKRDAINARWNAAFGKDERYSWAKILVDEFGFKRVEFSEARDEALP